MWYHLRVYRCMSGLICVALTGGQYMTKATKDGHNVQFTIIWNGINLWTRKVPTYGSDFLQIQLNCISGVIWYGITVTHTSKVDAYTSVQIHLKGEDMRITSTHFASNTCHCFVLDFVKPIFCADVVFPIFMTHREVNTPTLGHKQPLATHMYQFSHTTCQEVCSNYWQNVWPSGFWLTLLPIVNCACTSKPPAH